jgi:integrase
MQPQTRQQNRPARKGGREATGEVIERRGKDGRIYRSLRFRVGRERHRLALGVVSLDEARAELENVLADVRRGIWQPPTALPEPTGEVPTFHEFAEEWWTLHEHEWSPKTVEDYRWRLELHLVPRFKDDRLDAIDYGAVERYIAAKRREGLSPRSVNMTTVLLAAILEVAVERDLIRRNPAKGKGRRVRERTPERSYIDSAEAIAALLDAAAEGESRTVKRRAMLIVLCFAGLRVDEFCSLRWRDVDLTAGWLTVGKAKTDAGVRRVKLRGIVREELAMIRPLDADPDAFVFATTGGRKPSPTSLNHRVLAPAVKAANAKLIERGLPPMPHLTPHSLRRTFASVLYALGEPPPVVMAEMGHRSEGLALRIYAQAMRRGEDERAALRSLVEGAELPEFGPIRANEPTSAPESP